MKSALPRKVLVGACMGLFLLRFPPAVAAKKFFFKINSVFPAAVSSTEATVEVFLSITDLPSDSYFRVALQEKKGKPYFGYIKNNDGAWVKIESLSSDNCSKYYRVLQAATQVKLFLKVGAAEQQIQPGTYLVRAHRFTASSCSYTEATNSAVLEIATPTATPSPIPTSIPTSTPTPTPVQTASPPPATLAALVLTSTPLSLAAESEVVGDTISPSYRGVGSVLGEQLVKEADIFLPTASPSASPAAKLAGKTAAGGRNKRSGYFFISLGLGGLIAAAVSAYRIYKSGAPGNFSLL